MRKNIFQDNEKVAKAYQLGNGQLQAQNSSCHIEQTIRETDSSEAKRIYQVQEDHPWYTVCI